MEFDRYGSDVLSGDWKRKKTVAPAIVEAVNDLVVELASDGYCGAVVGTEGRMVRLEDRRGKVRLFPLGGGFLIDGRPVVLKAPAKVQARGGKLISASGSIAVTDARARVARASRIFVEGRHDAELVEKVWGHDLRIEGVVVEYIEGVDHLEQLLAEFEPGNDRRVGVLVDHLLTGSKESRIAQKVAAGPYGKHVLVVGHPYIDIWQSVKPARLGLKAWPVIPRGTEWKHGICEALRWPHEDQADIARAWQRILSRVDSWTDLEPELLGRVEQLIDFVTAQP